MCLSQSLGKCKKMFFRGICPLLLYGDVITSSWYILEILLNAF